MILPDDLVQAARARGFATTALLSDWRAIAGAEVCEKARVPMLAASLSGVDFGLPGMDGAFDDLNDSLLGDVQDTVMTAETVSTLPEPMSRVAPSRAAVRAASMATLPPPMMTTCLPTGTEPRML